MHDLHGRRLSYAKFNLYSAINLNSIGNVMLALRPLIPPDCCRWYFAGWQWVCKGTLIAIRGADEGFSTVQIGIIGAGYFLGFMIATLVVSRLLQAVGHIRLFAAMAAIAASGTLVLVLLDRSSIMVFITRIDGILFCLPVCDQSTVG